MTYDNKTSWKNRTIAKKHAYLLMLTTSRSIGRDWKGKLNHLDTFEIHAWKIPIFGVSVSKMKSRTLAILQVFQSKWFWNDILICRRRKVTEVKHQKCQYLCRPRKRKRLRKMARRRDDSLPSSGVGGKSLWMETTTSTDKSLKVSDIGWPSWIPTW